MKFKASITILLTALTLLSGRALAAKAPTGITVNPAYQQVSIQVGQAEVPVTFRVTNNESFPQTLNLSAADFNTLGETGGLFFVGSNPTQLQKKYGLAKWFSLPQASITIQPKETANINASILNLVDMPSGGHYGALMFNIQTSQNQSSKNKVSTQPVASSLMFVTKLGGDTHKLGLSSVASNQSLIKLPTDVTLRFHNDGNTHLIPRGIVSVIDPDGKVLSKGVINDNSGIILPETFRRYDVPLRNISSDKSFGSYKLRVDYRFDGYDQYRRYQTSFYILTPAVLIAILLLIAGSIYAYKNKDLIKKRTNNK